MAEICRSLFLLIPPVGVTNWKSATLASRWWSVASASDTILPSIIRSVA